jgi:hypothetical protein
MPQCEIICLANSRKHGGRCVAGLQTDGSGWLRPVGTFANGTIYPQHYTLNDGTEAGLLDVIQVGVRTHRPAPHQPENWVIDGTTWALIARPLRDNLSHVLQNAIVSSPELLRGFSDRVPYASFQQQNATASLALIAPDSINLYRQLSFSGRPQARGRFSLRAAGQASDYDLVVSDPRWEQFVIHQGSHTLRQAHSRFLVTISMGEPFALNCYKLIAAIIVLPRSIAAVLSEYLIGIAKLGAQA